MACLLLAIFEIFIENLDERTVIFRNISTLIFFKYITLLLRTFFCAGIAENRKKINQYTWVFGKELDSTTKLKNEISTICEGVFEGKLIF